MLAVVGYRTLDELVDATIPRAIRMSRPLAIHAGRSELRSRLTRATRGPTATAVAKKATGVRREFQTGRAGTRYKRALA